MKPLVSFLRPLLLALLGATLLVAGAQARNVPVANASEPEAGEVTSLADAASQTNASLEMQGRSAPADAVWADDFNRRSFEWHLISSKIIFVLVLGVVVFGLFVSWLQFRNDAEAALRRLEKKEGEGPDYDASFGLQNISIKSKTIGVIILFVSAGFFLMYLMYVYPMREAESGAPPLVTGPGSAPQAP